MMWKEKPKVAPKTETKEIVKAVEEQEIEEEKSIEPREDKQEQITSQEILDLVEGHLIRATRLLAELRK